MVANVINSSVLSLYVRVDLINESNKTPQTIELYSVLFRNCKALCQTTGKHNTRLTIAMDIKRLTEK